MADDFLSLGSLLLQKAALVFEDLSLFDFIVISFTIEIRFFMEDVD